MADTGKLTFIKNNTEVNNFTICNTSTCEALNITGDTLYFRIKEQLCDSDANAIYTTCVPPSGHTCGECGQTQVIVPESVTDTLCTKFYYWQINLVNDINLTNNMSYVNDLEVKDTLYNG